MALYKKVALYPGQVDVPVVPQSAKTGAARGAPARAINRARAARIKMILRRVIVNIGISFLPKTQLILMVIIYEEGGDLSRSKKGQPVLIDPFREMSCFTRDRMMFR